jgi:prepilin-type N-terminal cleavage/methylation domain-containing protein
MTNPRPSKLRNPGFTLIEIVIVLFLTGIILFAVSNLISRTFETLKFLQEKNRTLESATLGCERLASELSEAVGIDTPISAGQVVFRKVRPSAPEAVANDHLDMSVPAEDWKRDYVLDANGINQLAQVVYQVDSESKLRRTASAQTTLVATDVNAFTVSPLVAEGCFLVSLSLQEKRRVIVFETIVTCPALQGDFSP